MTLVYEQESFHIRGAIFEVYREMGCGFLESVYQECLECEFVVQNIPFCAQPKIKLRYKNQILNQICIPDFVCFDKIVIELKAVESLSENHRAQVHNYLNASGFKLAFLVNFGHFPKARIERIVK